MRKGISDAQGQHAAQTRRRCTMHNAQPRLGKKKLASRICSGCLQYVTMTLSNALKTDACSPIHDYCDAAEAGDIFFPAQPPNRFPAQPRNRGSNHPDPPPLLDGGTNEVRTSMTSP
mmetsp:Transcript_66790/g.178558  ORF Transcript_66790/g.178558 Transcript_66790/m.178558 type:complete len:117 (+) Transcript_66790:668-1018(+)